jgi:cysteine desulfurase
VEIANVLLALDQRDICASSGSACTSSSTEPSHVLLATGVPRDYVYGALRITFGAANCMSDVDRLLEVIPQVVASARGKLAVLA